MVGKRRADRQLGRGSCRTYRHSISGKPSSQGFAPGTELIVKGRFYRHHGIYVGNGRVIHYAGWFHSAHGLIEEIPLKRFTKARPCTIGQRPSNGAAAQQIVQRARSRLGEQSYDLLRNNCEHFCNWCRLGHARSGQVEALSKVEFAFCGLLQSLRSRRSKSAPVHAGRVAVA